MSENSEDTDESLSEWEGDASDPQFDELYEEVQGLLGECGMSKLRNKNRARQHVDTLDNLKMALTLSLLVTKRPKEDRGHWAFKSVEKLYSKLQASSGPQRLTDAAETRRWEKAFKDDFKVTLDYEIFLTRLEVIANRPKGLYARVLLVIQSSGVGKSRMLDKAAQTIFAFPICLRVSSEDAYPLGDPDVRQYLCKGASDKTAALLFLKHLLQAGLKRLSENPRLWTPSEWRAYLEIPSNRNTFYSEVCRSAEAETVRDSKSQAEAVESHIQTLVDKLQSPFFMIYIDEAHHLEKQNRGMIRELMSAMADVVTPQGHLLVLTSTNSQLSQLAPTPGAKAHDSTRWKRATAAALTQVWPTFPYKIFSTAPPEGEEWTPAHARSFEVSANTGRPLWGASMRHGIGKDRFETQRETAELAFIKMCKSQDLEERPSSRTLEAALVCRLYLGIERTRAGTAFASRLVASRMATALYVEQNRTSMPACYSVDPILGWAALQIIMCFSPHDVLSRLKKLTESGLIERASRGELITKLAIMSAYDRVLQTRYQVPEGGKHGHVSKIPHFSAVSLKEFLKSLSGSYDILNTSDIEGNVLLSQFEGCSTVLTQWTGSKGDETTVNVNLAVQAMLTHCGVQMPLNMPGIDHMLVFCKNESEPIGPSNLVVMLFQSKNRSQFKKDQVPRRILNRFTQQGVPVIFILHEVDKRAKQPILRKDETSTVYEDSPAAPQPMCEDETVPVWCLRMDGVNPELLANESIDDLFQAQSQPFPGRGETSEKSILGQLPMLCAEPDVQAHVWHEESKLFTTG